MRTRKIPEHGKNNSFKRQYFSIQKFLKVFFNIERKAFFHNLWLISSKKLIVSSSKINHRCIFGQGSSR